MNERVRSAAPFLLLFLAIIRPDVSMALSIDTTTGWNGTDSICCFGEPNTATYGQTITADATDIFLDSFTFYLDDIESDPDVVEFEAYVYAWNGLHATGAALFQSSSMSTTNNGGADGFEAFQVTTGGIELTPGQQYVLFFSATNFFDGSFGRSSWGTVNPGAGLPDVIPGGGFVFQNNGADFSTLTTNQWAIRQGTSHFKRSSARFQSRARPFLSVWDLSASRDPRGSRAL